MLPNKIKCYKKTVFRFQPKLSKNEENWQNPNCFMKFSEIWYVHASRKKKLQKTVFQFWHFLAFFYQKTAKIDKK